MSQLKTIDVTDGNAHNATMPNHTGVVPLTLAQVKASLIEAAKHGLIDGTELNESWFQNLRRDVYQATKKSKKGGKKESKPAAAKQEKAKKTSDVVTSFMKFDAIYSKYAFKGVNTTEELKTELLKHSESLLAIAKSNGWIDDKGKASVKDYPAVYALFGLNEKEQKAARTWFPYFFTKAPNGQASGK